VCKLSTVLLQLAMQPVFTTYYSLCKVHRIYLWLLRIEILQPERDALVERKKTDFFRNLKLCTSPSLLPTPPVS
jgi:hypothetical protein